MKRDRSDRVIGFAFLTTILAATGAAVVYALGGQVQLEGTLVGIGLAGVGAGLILWAKHLLPGGREVQDRGDLSPSTDEEAAAEESIERGVDLLERRSFLVKMGGAAIGALGIAAIFPVRSLGTRPGDDLVSTAWRDGVHVIASDGQRVRADRVAVGEILTVYPETAPEAADAVTLLIGLPNELDRPFPGREDWSVGDVVAYSKICTHVGCPVGLYEPHSRQLFCPCHQSVFDVANGARPIGGPATRALPQLPLDVDEDGFLIARGDFSEAPGPGFWTRPRP